MATRDFVVLIQVNVDEYDEHDIPDNLTTSDMLDILRNLRKEDILDFNPSSDVKVELV